MYLLGPAVLGGDLGERVELLLVSELASLGVVQPPIDMSPSPLAFR